MLSIKKSKSLQTVTALIALNLLAAACGPESTKKQRPQSIFVEFEGPIVVPTPAPEVTPTPNVMPTPAANTSDDHSTSQESSESTSEVIPTPEVKADQAPAAPLKHPLPASRELTEAEKLEYLTNTDSFIKLGPGYGYRGTGFDIEKQSFRGSCMEPDENIMKLETDIRPQEEYAILPLTSDRQVKAALGYKGHPLYMSGRIETDNSQRLGIVAIAKKIRRVESLESMLLKTSVEQFKEGMFDTRCGQVYKKGEVFGHVYYTLLWIELDAKTSREDVLSRLIDSQTLGTYGDQESFAKKLASLDKQLTDTEGLYFVGGETGFNFSDKESIDHGFDFSARLKIWSAAADQVELAKVPEVGSIFGSYPDRSTPDDLTGGKSQ